MIAPEKPEPGAVAAAAAVDAIALDRGDRRRLAAHVRHELRTSLTAVIGYSEHLLESAPNAPAEMAASLDALRAVGEGLLAEVNRRLSDDAVGGLDAGALVAVMRTIGEVCLGPAGGIEPRCAALIAAAEREGVYGLIPVLCRIQAAGVMLMNLLKGYSTAVPPKVLWAGQPIGLEAPLSLRAHGDAPRAPSSSSVFAPGSPSRRAEALAPPRGARVLVADDNSVTRDLLRHWLESQGHEVDEASGGRIAVERLGTELYDLLLLDLVMPDLSGIEVLDALREGGRLGEVPILMLSASDDVDAVVRCIERGADDYVTKPFNMVLLRARIRTSIELQQLRQRERAYLTMLQELRARAG